MLIGIDFDGTLVQGDKAIEGARDAVNRFREAGHKVLIFSCNNRKWIERVLADNDIRYDYIWDGDKPVCDIYIDDRNIEFHGKWDETVEKALKGRSRWSIDVH
jgi:hydroxymethylpyrimidine pyrophosphatase-like HAD family hydrolase